MKKKSLIKRILLVLAIILIINVGWYAITTLKYKKYIEIVPKCSDKTYSTVDKEGYTYSVKKPSYLSLTGNLAVVGKNGIDANLIIWPSVFGSYKYGLYLQDENNSRQIIVNEDLKPVAKEDEIAKKLLDENKMEIKILFQKAKQNGI